jgi:hypothetical protein
VPLALYFNAFQRGDVTGQLAMRTIGPSLTIAATAREAIRAVAPSIATTRVRTLNEQVDASIVRERMLGALSRVFGARWGCFWPRLATTAS